MTTPTAVTRRALVTSLLGLTPQVGTPSRLKATAPTADEVAEYIAGLPEIEPSAAAADWAALSDDDQRRSVTAAIEQFESMGSRRLFELGEPLHAVLPGGGDSRPPTLVADLDARLAGDRSSLVYGLRSPEGSAPFRSLGLVTWVDYAVSGASGADVYFNLHLDAVFLGTTNHTLRDADVPMEIQIGYFGGYHENRPSNRWVLPLVVGWIATDPAILSPFYGTRLDEESRVPLPAPTSRSGEQEPGLYGSARYQWALNTLFDVRGAGVVTLTVGLPGNIAWAEEDAELAVSGGLPGAFWSPEYRAEENEAARRYHDWLTWKALRTAITADPPFQLWVNTPGSGGWATPIESVFPQALDGRAPTTVPDAHEFLTKGKQTVSLEDLVRLPRFHIRRASPAPGVSILPG